MGIPSLALRFTGEGKGGVYHTRYDTFKHFVRFSDPGFKYCVALAKVAGHAIMRFADADILPYRFSDMASAIGNYMNQIESTMSSMREKRKYRKKLHADHAYKLASDPAKTYYPPKLKSPVPHINFAPLENAVARLSHAATDYNSALSAQIGKNSSLSKSKLAKLNHQLQSVPQALLSKQGLPPNRPWYRNMITAPSHFIGYGASTLPGIRYAVDERKWNLANKEIALTAKVINRYARRIEKATALMK